MNKKLMNKLATFIYATLIYVVTDFLCRPVGAYAFEMYPLHESVRVNRWKQDLL